jgi:hypothetical protein
MILVINLHDILFITLACLAGLAAFSLFAGLAIVAAWCLAVGVRDVAVELWTRAYYWRLARDISRERGI